MEGTTLIRSFSGWDKRHKTNDSEDAKLGCSAAIQYFMAVVVSGTLSDKYLYRTPHSPGYQSYSGHRFASAAWIDLASQSQESLAALQYAPGSGLLRPHCWH